MFARWRAARVRARRILGINKRNLHYIYPHNRREHFPLADNKLLTKELLRPRGIPMPETLRVYRHFYELRDLEADLAGLRDFVVKPATGSGGNGIIVVAGCGPDGWRGVSGREYSAAELRRHISDIIFGVYAFDLSDQAIVEERLVQHAEMDELSPFGLADVRVILHDRRPVMAMTRLPTRKSDGKANLHQGALGAGVDLESGAIVHAVLEGRALQQHPDSGVPLVGRRIPCWGQVLEICAALLAVVPLGYLGIDIAITVAGPKLLEINVRPGLQIQCANDTGLRALLEAGGAAP